MLRRNARTAVTPRFFKTTPRRPQNVLLQGANARLRRMLVARPRLYWTLLPVFGTIRRRLARLLLLVSGVHHDGLLDIYREVHVAPEAVQRVCRLPFSALRSAGPGWVLGGDWDLDTESFHDDRRYVAIRDVMVHGRRWDETESYLLAVESIDRGIPVWHCRTRTEYDQRCRAIEGLYHEIRTRGYMSQRELRMRRPSVLVPGRGDEVSVAVGRKGDFLFVDGAHRLAIAQLLRVPSIPVEVRVRHAEWMSLRRDLAAYCATHGGRVPQPLLHPDLETVPSQPGWDAAYELVAAQVGAESLVVDLEAGWGYVCQRLEAAGVACVAISTDARDRAWLRLLHDVCGQRFPVLDAPNADIVSRSAGGRTVLLALSPESPGLGAARVRRLADSVSRLTPQAVLISPESAALALAEATAAFTRHVRLGCAEGIGEVYRLDQARRT